MRLGRSGENILGYLAGHVRQAEVASTIVIRQTFVIEAHGTKDRRMKIVNVHGVLYGLQPKFVSSPVSGSTLDASTRQPHREAEWVVVAAILYRSDLKAKCPGLHHGCATELRTKDNQRFLKQATLLQVLK